MDHHSNQRPATYRDRPSLLTSYHRSSGSGDNRRLSSSTASNAAPLPVRSRDYYRRQAARIPALADVPSLPPKRSMDRVFYFDVIQLL
jgi:hypothetical protein